MTQTYCADLVPLHRLGVRHYQYTLVDRVARDHGRRRSYFHPIPNLRCPRDRSYDCVIMAHFKPLSRPTIAATSHQ